MTCADSGRQSDRLELDARKAGREQVTLNDRRVGIAEWAALHVGRGIVRKQRGDRGPRRIWNGVEFEPVEADEQVVAAGTKHAPCFLICADLVREEHRAKLAHNEVEAVIVEWQILGVRT